MFNFQRKNIQIFMDVHYSVTSVYIFLNIKDTGCESHKKEIFED